MRVLRMGSVLIVVLAGIAGAQGTKTAAPNTKQTAPATKQAAPATKQPATTARQTPAPAGATKTGAAPAAGAPAAAAQTRPGAGPQRRPALSIAPETAPPKPAVIMREVFAYDAGGRRDPFVSLLSSTELRPTVTDLRLVVVLFDETGRRPVAVMRDLTTNTQYRVTTGMTLGRMRVAEIKRRSVIFTIEEFGLNRQDSLVLGDTTKVRAR